MTGFKTDFLPKERLGDAYALYEASVLSKEVPYKLLTRKAFENLLIPRAKEDTVFVRGAFSEKDHDLAGFALIYEDAQLRRAFVSLLFIRPDLRRKGIGRLLLDDAAACLFSSGRERPVLEISYYNPHNFEWIVPDGSKTPHIHPNAQGVILHGAQHAFFTACGFRDFSYQNTYLIDVGHYEWPEEKLQPYEERLKKAGLCIEFYDPKKHRGMQALVEDLNNDVWRRQIPEEMGRKEGPRPLLIVNAGGEIGGFAGPIIPLPDGRCSLLGLGVRSDFRGHGAATVLFHRMLLAFREAGGTYMTFFTGEDNPARKIYEGAGARIVQSFAMMRRDR